MNITYKKFNQMLKKNPKTKCVFNRLIKFEDRMDMLLITFGGKNYEVEFPPNSLGVN